MKTKTIAGKLTLWMVIALFTAPANADYYYGTEVGCATPCCGAPCGRTVKYRVAAQQIYAPPVKKVKYYERKTRNLGGYNMTVYYVWPTYTGVVVAPACGGGCVQPVVRTYCEPPSCGDFYVPPEYYTTVSNDDVMDERTADVFSY